MNEVYSTEIAMAGRINHLMAQMDARFLVLRDMLRQASMGKEVNEIDLQLAQRDLQTVVNIMLGKELSEEEDD